MKTEKILVVEDEVIISLALIETLSNIGYDNVDSAFDSLTANTLLQENKYDLVLMDVNLGRDGKDGIDVVNKMKEKVDLPVIYVTGNSDKKTVAKAKTSVPYGFITKPVNEEDLIIQLEIALHKEKLKKFEIDEEEMIGSIYAGDMTGLTLDLGMDGQIFSISPNIKKITGKPSYFYARKTIHNSDFNKQFYDLLTNVLEKVKSTNQRSFYGSVFSTFLGERIVEINVETSVGTDAGRGDSSLLGRLSFHDLTEGLYNQKSEGHKTKVSIASSNLDITRGFRTVPSFVANTRISAELSDAASAIDYLSSNNKGIMVIDISLPGGYEKVLDFILENTENNTRVLVLLNTQDVHLLKSLNEYSFVGYFSKLADDATILEAIKLTANNINYRDPSI